MPVAGRTSGPLVSIVVIGRGPNGIPGELRDALVQTSYAPIEIRTAGSVAPDRAEAIDAAVNGAAGELVCLLDSRTLPVRPDWLGHLVDAVLAGPIAAGPMQVLRSGSGPVRATQWTRDLSVFSRGIDFARVHGLVRPAPLGRGDDPLVDDQLAAPEEVPALSLTCLLVRKADLISAGGYPVGYMTRDEEADPQPQPYAASDLACRLRRSGRPMVCDHRSVVLVRSAGAAVSTQDRETFLDRFGPQIAREVWADIIDGRHRWSRRPLHLVIAGRPGLAAGSVAYLDWQLDFLPGASLSPKGPPAVGTDALLVADGACPDLHGLPGGIVRVAWMVDGQPTDVDDYDLVLTTSAGARQLVDANAAKAPFIVRDGSGPLDELPTALRGWNASRRFAIRIGASNWPKAPLWGDYHFARSLQRSLERAGHPTTVRLVGDWKSEAAAREDATIHLFGRREAVNRPSQVNVLWQISHPDAATPELYDTYDFAFVASQAFARKMAARTRVAVATLDQATDPARFHPAPTGPRHELLYVANFREDRPVLDWLLPTSHDLAVYGRGWAEHGVEARHLGGEQVPNSELHRFYGSAVIVLNDTWADMRDAGFISNRIYDVLASGGFVISDAVAGIEEQFAGAVPVYHDRDDLRELVARFLADPVLRDELAARGHEIVLASHTFEHRAQTFLGAVRPALDARSGWIGDGAGTAPSGFCP